MGIRFGAPRTYDLSGAPLAASGFFWFAGSGEMQMSANQIFRTEFKNTSVDKPVSVALINLSATAAIFITARINATGNLPTTVRTVHNGIFDARPYSGVCTFKADVGTVTPTGGTQVSGALAVGIGPSDVLGPLIFPPGNSYTIWGQATGSNSVSISFAWVEFATA